MSQMGQVRRINGARGESASPSIAPNWRAAARMAAGRAPTSHRDCASEYAVDLGGHDEVVLMQSLDLLGL